ncbi:MAG: transcription termination factor NusA [Candidatus Microgenomates bacterium]
MTIIKSEFALALNQVATERGISPDDVIASIEAAVIAAYKKEYPENADNTDIIAKVNKETGETQILKDGKNITPPGFGRIAAQTAKQVILQKIREAEKKTVASHYQSQIGTILKGRIIRYDGHNAYLDIGKAEAILPKDEQIKNERYSVNNTMIVYLKSIENDKFGNPRIIVSRSHPNLITELFKREVPEVANGNVEIKKVVRDAGERAKIAVYSSFSGIDPVGACVGQKGVRVQTVTDELGGNEKIDVIQWSQDQKQFLISALSPAKIQSIELDKNGKKTKVFVTEEEAPLAIGKNGINVNLASELTNLTIDIVQVKVKSETNQSSATEPQQKTQ